MIDAWIMKAQGNGLVTTSRLEGGLGSMVGLCVVTYELNYGHMKARATF